MPTNHVEKSSERRDQTRVAIDKLLEERQKVLIHYERVAGVEPYSDGAPSQELLERFSQLLMDYIALGHFGLYQRISEGNERRRRVIAVAEETYPVITATTDKALDFNDAYERADKSNPFESLADKLSELGEVLALRIELEDKLLAAMLE